MKIKLILLFTALSVACSLRGQQPENSSYRYYAEPGFVNISELTGGIGLMDTAFATTENYLGATNIFGYQINRNFFGGIGIGYLQYNGSQVIPVYLEYKYSAYMKRLTPYVYADGGLMIAPVDLKQESKIFINPGIGVSRYISSRFEGNFSVGFLIQTRSVYTRARYINFKLGIIFRKNSFRMFKANNTVYN